MPRWKKLLLALLLLPALAVLLLETVPRFVPVPGLRLDDLDPFRDPIRKARVEPHPYLAYAPKPSFRFRGPKQSIDHNALGFRGPEIEREKPPGTFRIACLGGSSTYGHGPSSNATTWPVRLEHHLRERYPGRSIEVVNGGCQGYSTFESVQNLAHRVLPLSPDLVIVYHVINDVRCALYPGVRPDNAHWRAVWMQRQPTPLESSYTFLVWRRYLSEEMRLRGDIASFAIVDFDGKVDKFAWRPGEVEVGLASYRRNLHSILALARENGARAILGTEALRVSDVVRDYPGSHADQLRCYQAMCDILAEVASERGVPLVDVRTPLESEAARQIAAGAEADDIFTREVHVTDQGAERIARTFAEAIISTGWLE
jgi:lysophospholipase L1-like esterase